MQPKIYHFEDHDISPKKIDKHAFYIIEKLKQKGFQAYLVGGSVRDLLLKQIPKDFDISTSAKPEEIKKIFKKCFLIGKRFRLAHVRFGKKILEVATFRAGDIESSALILHNNVWGTAEEDVLRRDFTINGLFYDPENQIIIDYVNGFEDAKKKILKTIGNPIIRFIQDPVRMIRLLKFKARFDFAIDEPTLQALKQSKNEIKKSSQARILEELFRMLQSGASEKFFQLLQTFGLLALLLPKISAFSKNNKKIYQLLKQVDIYALKHKNDPLERAILLSCLLFPMVEELLQKQEKKKLHLGEIAEEIRKFIPFVFFSFFHLPRKMKIAMISILTNQFRFTPLKKIKKRIHIPNDPFFPLAMKFFKLRSMQQKNLLKVYTLWNEHIVESHKKHEG